MDIVHELNMADHRKYNKLALKQFFNPTRFGHISDASKFMKSARMVIPLAPLVHGFTSEPDTNTCMDAGNALDGAHV
jgi:hypothetical protein